MKNKYSITSVLYLVVYTKQVNKTAAIWDKKLLISIAESLMVVELTLYFFRLATMLLIACLNYKYKCNGVMDEALASIELR